MPHHEVLDHDITVIDTGFGGSRFDAAYLITDQGRAAFVDSGTNDSVPRLLEALQAQGLDREAVDYVIVTHVHLDHAGGAGALMAQCPQARLVVHPRGARHMVDPSALVAGASAVYGEAEVERTYGRLVPVPANRVLTPGDGERLRLGQRDLVFIDTPGHARHHHCIWDERSRGWFTGDTFGLCYPALETPRGPFILPTTTPVQFEPEALHASIRRMMDYQPEWVYLTHYGRFGSPQKLADQLHPQIDAMVHIALAHRHDADAESRIAKDLLALYTQHWETLAGTAPAATLASKLALDVQLNAQGLCVWLTKLPTNT